MQRLKWLPFTVAEVACSSAWGAYSALPTAKYGYPPELIYAVWAVVMLVPAAVVLRRGTLDRRPVAAAYGIAIGLTGAGGQLLLIKALSLGPAYVVFPIVSLSPALTVLLAVVLLAERLPVTAGVGVLLALCAVVLFGYSGGAGLGAAGGLIPLVAVVATAWGVQAFLLRKAAMSGVGDTTTFFYMAFVGLLLVPISLYMLGHQPLAYPWEATTMAAGIQLLNAVGALFLVMALSRGRASVVVPITSSLSPTLTTLLSLASYQRLPPPVAAAGMVLAVTGSALTTFGTRHDHGEPAQA